MLWLRRRGILWRLYWKHPLLSFPRLPFHVLTSAATSNVHCSVQPSAWVGRAEPSSSRSTSRAIQSSSCLTVSRCCLWVTWFITDPVRTLCTTSLRTDTSARRTTTRRTSSSTSSMAIPPPSSRRRRLVIIPNSCPDFQFSEYVHAVSNFQMTFLALLKQSFFKRFVVCGCKTTDLLCRVGWRAARFHCCSFLCAEQAGEATGSDSGHHGNGSEDHSRLAVELRDKFRLSSWHKTYAHSTAITKGTFCFARKLSTQAELSAQATCSFTSFIPRTLSCDPHTRRSLCSVHCSAKQELDAIYDEYAQGGENHQTRGPRRKLGYASGYLTQLGVVCARATRNLIRNPQATVLQVSGLRWNHIFPWGTGSGHVVHGKMPSSQSFCL